MNALTKAIPIFALFQVIGIISATAQQTIHYTNGMVSPSTIFDTNGASPITLTIPSGSATQGGAIISPGTLGSIIKDGAGTIVLTGTNTYTGGTTISQGTLAVQGPGSINHPSGQFSVGATNGTLLITNGGQVTSTNGVIANAQLSTGTATVTGTGLYGTTNGPVIASTWTMNGPLYDGYGGTGTLNVLDSVVTRCSPRGSGNGFARWPDRRRLAWRIEWQCPASL